MCLWFNVLCLVIICCSCLSVLYCIIGCYVHYIISYMYVYIRMCMCICMCNRICICNSICMCICMYVYIYIYIYIHTYIYIYIYAYIHTYRYIIISVYHYIITIVYYIMLYQPDARRCRRRGCAGRPRPHMFVAEMKFKWCWKWCQNVKMWPKWSSNDVENDVKMWPNCCFLRRQRDEQVPTRSPIAFAQTIQTIHNYSVHNLKFNEIGCTTNLLRGPGPQPRRKFTPLDPGNHGLPLCRHTSTGCFPQGAFNRSGAEDA